MKILFGISRKVFHGVFHGWVSRDRLGRRLKVNCSFWCKPRRRHCHPPATLAIQPAESTSPFVIAIPFPLTNFTRFSALTLTLWSWHLYEVKCVNWIWNIFALDNLWNIIFKWSLLLLTVLYIKVLPSQVNAVPNLGKRL